MTTLPTLGFIGLGAMGSPMLENLLRAGYPVYAFDLSEERLQGAVAAGARAEGSAGDVVSKSEWVLTSLPSSDAFVRVAEGQLIPNAWSGQLFIDFGTVTPPETRRLAALFEAEGAALIDAPVSGGPGGAERGDLYIFVGGDPALAERCGALLGVLGDPARVTYCGPSGSGQVVKGVNQLMMGLVDAAYLEAVAFGVRAGVDAEVIARALGDTGRWRKDFSGVAARVARGEGREVGVKFRELPYFLREAQERGFRLPLTETLYTYLDAGERVTTDDNRAAPSFWRQLMTERL